MQRHLLEIVDYAAQDNPAAAAKIHAHLLALARRLADFPAMGRRGIVPDTREVRVASLPYRVVYRLNPEAITLLAIFHTARDAARLRASKESPP